MDWLATLGGGAISSFLGGITGLAGSWITYKKEKAKLELEIADRQNARDHQILVMDKELAMMDLEARTDMYVAEKEAKAITESSADSLMADSYDLAKHDKGKVGDGIISSFFETLVELLRRMVRPIAAYCAIAYLYYAGTWANRILEEEVVVLSQQQYYDIVMYIIWSTIYVASTIILWYYGVRSRSPAKLMGRQVTSE